MLAEAYKPEAPGAAVIVSRDGETLIRRAYGMANLELGVRMRPEMVFRVGSVTKQFTAVAILMLVQEGKLALEDEITAFLPGYPVQGRRITIEHLLTHTSGIKSYTALPTYPSFKRKSHKPAELIDLFKDEPFDFAPGEKFLYNNSGYVLLGAIIEAVTGLGYADFLRQRIFEPLGMSRTAYGYPGPIMPGRVPGYAWTGGGFQNADYLSMTIALCRGAHSFPVSMTSRAGTRHWTRRRCSRGNGSGGPGLARSFRTAIPSTTGMVGRSTERHGRRVVEHGGGIDGFLCHVLKFPEDKVTVAILQNYTAPGDFMLVGLLEPQLDQLALRIAAAVVGDPLRSPRRARLQGCCPGPLRWRL